ncbi:MAG: peptidoglycan editing factor PgeF [Prevotellaceae bacterium]|nr:peptidoglycan editing factor PgeF [Prevotellaceae bacterium]
MHDKHPTHITFGILNQHKSEVLHFSSTRNGGVSKGTNLSLNLGFHEGDSDENVVANRKILATNAGFDFERLVVAQQTHSANVATVDESSKGKGIFSKSSAIQDCDAFICSTPNICIVVQTADCVPILLFDPRKKVVAAIHAGWRGTTKRIAQQTLSKMREEYNCDTNDIVAAIGPSIGSCCYEVGIDVIEEVTKNLPSDAEACLIPSDNVGKMIFDVRLANKLQLIESGIQTSNIEVSNICTKCNHTNFFSARYDRNKTGRMMSGIMLR